MSIKLCQGESYDLRDTFLNILEVYVFLRYTDCEHL
jgi:hypothetical protein